MICLVHKGKFFANECDPFVPYLIFQYCIIASLRRYTVLSLEKMFSWIYQQVMESLCIFCRFMQNYKVHACVISMEFSAANRRRPSRKTPLVPEAKKNSCFHRLWLGTFGLIVIFLRPQCCHFILFESCNINLQLSLLKTVVIISLHIYISKSLCLLIFFLSYTQAFSQDLKSGNLKCAIVPAQMNSLQQIKNKMIFFNKWLSTGCLDAHLAKSLPTYQLLCHLDIL